MTETMFGSVSRPVRRLLAITFLLLAVLGIVEGLIAPVADSFREQAHTYSEHARYLDRAKRLAQSENELISQREELTQKVLGVGRLYTEGDISQAQNRFQSAMFQLGSQSGILVENVTQLSPMSEGGLTHMRLRMQLSGDIKALRTFWEHASRLRPSAFVDHFAVRAPAAANAYSKGQNPRLDIGVTISAYYMNKADLDW